jgi:HemY protein
MMRIALWLLALFAIAVAFTLTARLDQGYVIVVYPPWRLELSFMLALLLLAGLMALAYAALRLGGIALNLSGDLRAWREKRRRDKADGLLLDALRAHLDGDGERARQLAAKAGEHCLAPDLARRLAEGARPAAAPAPNSTPNSTPNPASNPTPDLPPGSQQNPPPD